MHVRPLHRKYSVLVLDTGYPPEARSAPCPKRRGAAFAPSEWGGGEGPFRRSAPSCWHRSPAARGSGQSLIIAGSARSGVAFVRKQLSVLRGRRQSEEAEQVRFLHSGARGVAGCGVCFSVLTRFVPYSVCLRSHSWIQVLVALCQNVSCTNMKSRNLLQISLI